MKFFIALACFCLPFIVLGQEISLGIPITIDMRSDNGRQIEKLNDGYLILGGTFCSDSLPYAKCLGLLKTDFNGNTIWSAVFDGSPYGSLRPSGRTMFIHNDTIHVANMIWKNDHDELRMMSFDMDGNQIQEVDVFIPYEDTYYLRGMIGTEEKLIVFSEAKQNELHRILVQDFDFQFNLLDEYHIAASPNSRRGIDLKTRNDGGYILAHGEYENMKSFMHVTKLDSNYNVQHTVKLPYRTDTFQSVDILETAEDRYAVAFFLDTLVLHKFWGPSAVYGLDSLFNLEWEYIFFHRTIKQHISTILTEEGNILGIGGTDYLTIAEHDSFSHRSLDGWCFLLSPDGELLWERIIADIRDSDDALLWHGLETEDGYVMTGYIDKDNPTGVPFLNDPEVWFLTLDKNGCWNGNCGDIIIITDDSTSYAITDAHEAFENEPLIKVFPNPTAGLLTIENMDAAALKKRSVQISDMNGRLITDFELRAPKSTINLRGMENGLYIITQMVEGRPVSSQTIIINH